MKTSKKNMKIYTHTHTHMYRAGIWNLERDATNE